MGGRSVGLARQVMIGRARDGSVAQTISDHCGAYRRWRTPGTEVMGGRLQRRYREAQFYPSVQSSLLYRPGAPWRAAPGQRRGRIQSLG